MHTRSRAPLWLIAGSATLSAHAGTPVNFEPGATIVTGPRPASLITAQFNNTAQAGSPDTHADLAVVDQHTNQLVILRGNGNASFQGHSFSTVTAIASIFPFRASSTNRTDLVVSYRETQRAVDVWMNRPIEQSETYRGDGTSWDTIFSPQGPGSSLAPGGNQPSPIASAARLAAGFIGGFDQRRCIVGLRPTTPVVAGGPNVMSRADDGEGSYNGVDSFQSVDTQPRGVAFADFSNDGANDIAIISEGQNSVRVFYFSGWEFTGGAIWINGPIVATDPRPVSIVTADFNQDSFPDLAVACAGTATNPSSSVQVFYADGEGGFDTGPRHNVGFEPVALGVGAINEDALPDLIVTTRGYRLREITRTGLRSASNFAAKHVSDNGADIAAWYQRWNQTSGLSNIGAPSGGNALNTDSDGISGDATTIFGRNGSTPMRSVSGTASFLTLPSPWFSSTFRAISSSGAVAFAQAYGGGSARSLRWLSGSFTEICTDRNDEDEIVADCSANGNVAVGTSSINFGRRGFAWSAATNTTQLLPLPVDYEENDAVAVTSDGTALVGNCYDNGFARTCRWTIGSPAPDFIGTGGIAAIDASNDASRIVGQTQNRYFLWDQSNNYRSAETVIDSLGYDVNRFEAGWQTVRVSGDGSTLAYSVRDDLPQQNTTEPQVVTARINITPPASLGPAQNFPLSSISGTGESQCSAISANTEWVVGLSQSAAAGPSGQEAFRRPFPTGAMQGLGFLPSAGNFKFSWASACSADASVVTGSSQIDGAFVFRAYRWTSAGGMVAIPTLPGGETQSSFAAAVSRDGRFIVGVSANQAFRHDGNTNTTSPLGFLNPAFANRASSADACSADGSVVVGSSTTNTSTRHAFRWVGGVMTDLLPGTTFNSFAKGVSADGSVVVGLAQTAGTHSIFRWTQATGAVLYPLPAGWESMNIKGVAEDGNVAVGIRCFSSCSGCGDNGVCGEAAIWTTWGGTRLVRDLLIEAGANVTGWTFNGAYSVSPDGRLVCGRGRNPQGLLEAWTARLAPETAVLLNAGTGSFEFSTPILTPHSPTSLALADFNNDARTDIAVASKGAQGVSIFLNTPPACPGDANGDNQVNGSDLSVILSLFGQSVPPGSAGDFNNNGVINGADLSVFLANFGSSC